MHNRPLISGIFKTTWVILFSVSAHAQSGTKPSTPATTQPLGRALFWVGSQGSGQLEDVASWSLKNKEMRKHAAEEARKAGKPEKPEERLSPSPGREDNLIFEDDASPSMGSSLQVGALSFDSHSLRISAQLPHMSLILPKDRDFSLPNGSPGGSLQLSTVTFETGPVHIGDAIALLPSIPRNTITVESGVSWKISGEMSFTAGTVNMSGGMVQADSVGVGSDANLNLNGGEIVSRTETLLGPATTGRIAMHGGKLEATSIRLTTGSPQASLVLSGGSLSATDEIELNLAEGLDGAIALSGGIQLNAQQIAVRGEGGGKVNVDGGTLAAADVFRVSAGDPRTPAVTIGSGGRVQAQSIEIFQGVAQVDAGGSLRSQDAVRVADGILRLTGGEVLCRELRLEDIEASTPDGPNRSKFQSAPGTRSPEMIQAELNQDPALAAYIAREMIAITSRAGQQALTIDPFHAPPPIPPDAEAGSSESEAGEVSLSADQMAAMLAVLLRTNSDAAGIRSLGDLDAIMRRATGQLNHGTEPDAELGLQPGAEGGDPLAQAARQRLMSIQFDGSHHASVLEGGGTVTAAVYNAGEIRPDVSTVAFSRLNIGGVLTQAVGGTISVRVDGAAPSAGTEVTGERANHSIAAGAAIFEQPDHYLPEGATGEQIVAALRASVTSGNRCATSGVRVDFANTHRLEPGMLFDVLEVGAFGIAGRVPRFANCRIPGRDDLFLGIAQEKLFDHSMLRLLVLRAPQRVVVGPGDAISLEPLMPLSGQRVLKHKIAIVTHGTMSKMMDSNSGYDGQPSMTRVAVEMARFAHANGLDDEWDVVIFDWRDFSTGPDGQHAYGGFQPFHSAHIGREIGASLVDWLMDSGFAYTSLKEIHVLSHSSGTWMIDGFAKRLKTRSLEFGPAGKPHMHLTAFDAFAWPQGALGELSDAAEVTEHYLDGRLPGTRSPHPHAANIDVVWLDPELENELRPHLYSPLFPSDQVPAWTGTDGHQENPKFVGVRLLNGLFIKPGTRSDEIVNALHLQRPDEVFRYFLLDPAHSFGHAWPYEWYARTIEAAGGKQPDPGAVWCPKLCWEKWGFVNSPMYADFLKRNGQVPVDRLSSLDKKRIHVVPESGDCKD